MLKTIMNFKKISILGVVCIVSFFVFNVSDTFAQATTATTTIQKIEMLSPSAISGAEYFKRGQKIPYSFKLAKNSKNLEILLISHPKNEIVYKAKKYDGWGISKKIISKKDTAKLMPGDYKLSICDKTDPQVFVCDITDGVIIITDDIPLAVIPSATSTATQFIQVHTPKQGATFKQGDAITYTYKLLKNSPKLKVSIINASTSEEVYSVERYDGWGENKKIISKDATSNIKPGSYRIRICDMSVSPEVCALGEVFSIANKKTRVEVFPYKNNLKYVFCDIKRPLAGIGDSITEQNYKVVLDSLKNKLGCNGIRTYIDMSINDPLAYPPLYYTVHKYAQDNLKMAIYANPLGTGNFKKTNDEFANLVINYANTMKPKYLGPFNESGYSNKDYMDIADKVRAGLKYKAIIIGPDQMHVAFGQNSLINNPEIKDRFDIISSHNAVDDQGATKDAWNLLVKTAKKPVWATESPRPWSILNSQGVEVGNKAIAESDVEALTIYRAFPMAIDQNGALTTFGKGIADGILKQSATGTPSSSITTYISDLELGITHPDVLTLQKYLNSNGYIINETLGEPGSIGYESDYFGEKTKQALIKFQKDKGLSPAEGYFGAKTRAMMGM
jgi:hypothetical protein